MIVTSSACPSDEGTSSPTFEGDAAALTDFLRGVGSQTYVYVLCRPDGTPFYVGKGSDRRALMHEAEARRNHPLGESNPFKCNVIRKILKSGGEVLYRIEAMFPREQERECLRLEHALIERYGRFHEGGVLTNLSGGMGSTSGASPYSLERHAATLSGEPEGNPERAILNRFLQAIGPVRSVPVKPLSQIRWVLPTTPHSSPRAPSLRCAYALVASAAAHGLVLEPGVLVPRTFVHEGVAAIIENGVSRDLVKADMADLVGAVDPRGECYRLSLSQIDGLVDLMGREALSARGLL